MSWIYGAFVMTKKNVKVLDCTIRDGGLINNHYFSDDFVRAVYKAISKSGIDYMEFGYRSSKHLSPPDEYGDWKYCDDDRIQQIIEGIESNLKLSVMVDAHRIKEQEFVPIDQSPLDMVRLATYVKDVDKAIEMIKKTHDLGYETTANIMTISKEEEPDIIEALKKLGKCPADAVYVVDSYGSLLPEKVNHLVRLYKELLPHKLIGVHCHNSLQLAFANTIEGINAGADYADGSLLGIGRGSGNCCLELLVCYSKNPAHDIMPILDVIQNHMIPLREEIEWGYMIPYMITGFQNEHPRDAVKLRKTEDKDNYVQFYEEIHKMKG
jgi:4-hydroxy 2-oxovalerate aldolase